jgi:hypothetical protein
VTAERGADMASARRWSNRHHEDLIMGGGVAGQS